MVHPPAGGHRPHRQRGKQLRGVLYPALRGYHSLAVPSSDDRYASLPHRQLPQSIPYYLT
jgi:hypothetical protein